MPATTAKQVADYLLSFSHEHGDVLTNLKLQKLVYYAQAWHLGLFGKPLFDDPIEAWVHGPVVRSLYDRFKKYRWGPIMEDPKRPKLPALVEAHLGAMLQVYGKHSAWDLERMTHAEEPWQKARGNLAPDEEGHDTISQRDMKDFYSRRSKQA